MCIGGEEIYVEKYGYFPGSSIVKTGLPLQGPTGLILARELRSHMLAVQPKKCTCISQPINDIILRVYLQIICLDGIHHIHDGEVSGPAAETVFNLLESMGSTSSGSRVWQQGIWKGVVDSGLEDTVVLEVELCCSPVTLLQLSISVSLSLSLVKFLYPARPLANFPQIAPCPRLP